MLKFIYALSLSFLVSGCAAVQSAQLDYGISQYHAAERQVSIGDDKEKVLGILLPTQTYVPSAARRGTDKYIREGKSIEVYYMRSGRNPDNVNTDDEFVPYVFADGILVSMGWQALGGPQTRAQAVRTIIDQR